MQTITKNSQTNGCRSPEICSLRSLQIAVKFFCAQRNGVFVQNNGGGGCGGSVGGLGGSGGGHGDGGGGSGGGYGGGSTHIICQRSLMHQ